jgi:filamentous hemagglutinin family protein
MMKPARYSFQTFSKQSIAVSSFFIVPIFISLFGFTKAVFAQAIPAIVPDATLLSPSNVTDSGVRFEIDGGTQQGSNLFHSFSSFSVPVNYGAQFQSNSSIKNIITRVTGNSVSQIDGVISIPDASINPVNFFLINPNGVLLGEGASFSIGGSLLITSANSLRFSDGVEFSATQPNNSLLSLAIPVGLQLGSSAAPVSTTGPGHDFFQEDATNTIFRFLHPSGMELGSGNTLALVGGDITMQGGNLTVPSGNVEFGAVKSGYVGLLPNSSGWTLDYSGVTAFGDISLSGAASIDTSGAQGGSFRAQARNITFSDGAVFLSQNEGDFVGRESLIRATNSISLSGISPPLFGTEPGLPTAFISETSIDSTGQAGNLTIEAPKLMLADGAQISNGTYGPGSGGILTIRAQDVTVTGSTDQGPSAIVNNGGRDSTGNAGSINILANSLTLGDNALITSQNFGKKGNGGSINIQADRVALFGSDVIRDTGTGIFAGADVGDGGKIQFNVGDLSLIGGTQVTSFTSSSGQGGDIAINARTVRISGSNSRNNNSGIYTIVISSDATGNAGNLTLNTGALLVSDGGQISTSTRGIGNAGELTVTADRIQVSGSSPDGIPSGIFTTVQSAAATGNAGNLTLKTGDLLVTAGGEISTSTQGLGNAGNLSITADRTIQVDGNGSAIDAAVKATGATGNAGSLTLKTGDLLISNGGQISASTNGSGNAGELNVTADRTIRVEGSGSSIDTAVKSAGATGNAGNLTLTTQDLQVGSGGQISASTQGSGNAGNLDVIADRVQVQGPSSISTAVQSAGATGNAGNLTVQTSDLLIREGGQITSKTQGIGNAGNLNVMADRILIDGSNGSQPSGLFASVTPTATGNGGLLSIATMKLDVLNGGRITADSAGAGAAGSLNIRAQSIDLAGMGEAGPSALLGTVTGSGDGRDLTVVADRLTVRDGATIAVGNTLVQGLSQNNPVTQGSGKVGNLNLDIGSLILAGGSLSAQSLTGDRGSINIRAKTLNLRYGSQINANALGDATGGNIDIQTQLLFAVLTENSDITANAITNRGGAVRIQTNQLLGLQAGSRLSPLSDITASSEQGAQFGGLVEIKATETDLSRTLSRLPSLQTGVEPIRVSCSASQGNTLTTTGKGGVPVTAEQPIRSGILWGGSGVATAIAPPSQPPKLVQANAWTKDASGRVQLLAQSAAALAEAGCLANP